VRRIRLSGDPLNGARGFRRLAFLAALQALERDVGELERRRMVRHKVEIDAQEMQVKAESDAATWDKRAEAESIE
jgi:hypothetical protein